MMAPWTTCCKRNDFCNSKLQIRRCGGVDCVGGREQNFNALDTQCCFIKCVRGLCFPQCLRIKSLTRTLKHRCR